ncbi:HsdR family type I site-specific deoxyribonuclease, partial [bacterium]|nr:HsdR family type I site-specific deoxyribonuclease [bacterium]
MTSINSMPLNEAHLSQFPAVTLLHALGYQWISPSEAQLQRKNKLSNVILEDILHSKLHDLNQIHFRGKIYKFSDENIKNAIHKLKTIQRDGLLKTNETIYDLLTLGTSFEQTINGYSKSFSLKYIDWQHPERNSYHVTTEFKVQRSRSTQTARPDIILFINGIPLVVIECKSPKEDVNQAVSQMIRNQGNDYIPQLFSYSQLVIATNRNKVKYGTTGTPAKFWSVWKEAALNEASPEYDRLAELVNQPLSDNVQKFIGSILKIGRNNKPAVRQMTEQDKAIYALCRPERLLELVWKFTLFDGGEKKIARYQQYFVVKSALKRVKHFTGKTARKGGIIWQTQGSGKTLTMVMLTRNLALDPNIKNPRIVLVTDRDNLDKQLANTFTACGLEPCRATSGRNLVELVKDQKAGIVTTLVHKFDKAIKYSNYQDPSSDIFVLVDESHRTQFGLFSARMKQMFPNASYLGFTGTPLMKKEKNNFRKFGSLIEPYYSNVQAIEDEAVVPLLYESRHSEMAVDKVAIDIWFERLTKQLNDKQKTDLKRKFARAEVLNKTDQVVCNRAYDISMHFQTNWKGSGFKAQLVAPNKATALKYKKYLDEIGDVSSEVLISAPDVREGFEEIDDEPTDAVVKFWQKMMNRFGKEEIYTKQLINQFKHGDDPEILIVVSKLLTGFDAPRNRILYLCRTLKEHTLLQAIARVNRLFEDKDFGVIIDYAGVLGELDKALTMYKAFEGFDESDLEGTLQSIDEEVKNLPVRHAALLNLFKPVQGEEEEIYEQFLADEAIRETFYERLTAYGKTLAIAFSSSRFLYETDDKLVNVYRKDLRWFEFLRASVKRRYAEVVDFREIEPKIMNLMNRQIHSSIVKSLHEPVDIFNEKSFRDVVDEQGAGEKKKSTASKADTIAHATKRVV